MPRILQFACVALLAALITILPKQGHAQALRIGEGGEWEIEVTKVPNVRRCRAVGIDDVNQPKHMIFIDSANWKGRILKFFVIGSSFLSKRKEITKINISFGESKEKDMVIPCLNEPKEGGCTTTLEEEVYWKLINNIDESSIKREIIKFALSEEHKFNIEPPSGEFKGMFKLLLEGCNELNVESDEYFSTISE